MFNDSITTAKNGFVALKDWDGKGDKDLIDLCNEICKTNCNQNFGTHEELTEDVPICAGCGCPFALPDFYTITVKLAEYEAKGSLSDFEALKKTKEE